MKPLGFTLEEMAGAAGRFASLADDPADVAALGFVEHCRREPEEGRADLVQLPGPTSSPRCSVSRFLFDGS